jgi:hypothetical protein
MSHPETDTGQSWQRAVMNKYRQAFRAAREAAPNLRGLTLVRFSGDLRRRIYAGRVPGGGQCQNGPSPNTHAGLNYR